MKTRRTFLQSTLITTALFTVACDGDTQSILDSSSPLAILKLLQVDLYPQKSIENANAYLYLSVILKHTLVTEEDKQYLRNGSRWLNEEAFEEYKKNYIELDAQDRQDLLQSIASKSWGKAWLKTVLTYIIEATLGDPIYGINKNESGWKWLEHESGLPRPTKALL